MSLISVTTAETFKQYLRFIDNWDRKKNISYHLQYVDFLYKIKKIHTPGLTTLSLMNKTIIIEYFTIIEAIIDALLCQLSVKIEEDSYVSLDVNEYMNAGELLQLAKKYHIIDTEIHSKLGQVKNIRNRIHIKRPRKSQKYEYKAYTPKILKQHEKIFKNLMVFLFEKNDIDYNDYQWPWKIQLYNKSIQRTVSAACSSH